MRLSFRLFAQKIEPLFVHFPHLTKEKKRDKLIKSLMESSTPFRSAKRGAVGEKLCDTLGEVVPEILGRKIVLFRVEPDGCARYSMRKCRGRSLAEYRWYRASAS